ncbi:MAG: hypothetical protein K1X53_10570 [Candidatus Sumerlaeaceae bacterium]|nr:hypothetical protein [Candidatus Sumerlaeaceae bacterium]
MKWRPTSSNVAFGAGMVVILAVLLFGSFLGNDWMGHTLFLVGLLLGSGLCYFGIYRYVREKGYHGAWMLLIFAGPIAAGIMKYLGYRFELGLGESANTHMEGLISLSGFVVLVLLPRRRVAERSA